MKFFIVFLLLSPWFTTLHADYCDDVEINNYDSYSGTFRLSGTYTVASDKAGLYITGWLVLRNNSTFIGDVYATGRVVVNAGATIEGDVYAEKGVVTRGTADITGDICRNGDAIDFDETPGYYFEIITSSNALTCEAHSLTINVKTTEDNSLATNYEGLITLSANATQATWALSSGNGAFSNSANEASYQFVTADEGSATFDLSYSVAGDVIVSVVDDTDDIESTDSETITFNSTLIKTALTCENTVNGVCTNTANLPFSLTLSAVKEADDSELCEYYDPTGIKFWSEYLTPSSPQGNTALEINAEAIGKTEANATQSTLSFIDGIAIVDVNYPDAGLIAIHLQDSDNSLINGEAEVLINPFALHISDVSGNPAQENNYDPSAGSSTGFLRAAVRAYDSNTTTAIVDVDSFDITVKAVIDCENGRQSHCTDGDETLAKSFENDISLSPSLVFPTGGAAVLGSVHSAEGENELTLYMTGGELTYSDLSYDEVGVLGLQASSRDYIQSTNDIESSEIKELGRFYPAYLAYGDYSFTAGCNDFTYMTEGLSTDIPLFESAVTINYVMQAKAQASESATEKNTLNYDASLGYPVAPNANFSDTADSKYSTVDVSTRILPSTYYDETQWQSGVYTITALAMGLQKSSTTIDGPYFSIMPSDESIDDQIEYYIQLTGVDDEALQIDADTACATSNCRLPADPDLSSFGDFAYGRLQAGNGHGSEYQSIRTLIEATYFNGSEFVSFADDTCTTLVNEQFSASPTMSTNNAIAVSSGSSTLSIVNSTLNSGKGYLQFSAPDSRGELDYFIRLKDLNDNSLYSPWLLDSGNEVICPDDSILTDCISGHVQFGLFRGNDRIIYRMQTF